MMSLIKKSKILFVCCLCIVFYKHVDVYAEEDIVNKSEEEVEQGLVYDGLNYYDSINEALDNNNASELSLVLLDQDVMDTSFTIAENRNVTIDLNGNKLYIGTSHGVGITNNGSLKIYDRLGEGSIISYCDESTEDNYGYIPKIQTVCIDNYSSVTIQNTKISSNVFIRSKSIGILEYKFLYNHEDSIANIDNVTIDGEHNASSSSSLISDHIFIDDFFLYNEFSNVNIKGMTYSISSENRCSSNSPVITTGGNAIYQKGGNLSCDNLIITDSSIDKGIYVFDNSDVEIMNSSVKATTIGLEVDSGSTVILKDSRIYSTEYGVKSSASSIKINRSNITVSSSKDTIVGIENSNGGNVEIGKDPDNNVENMKIEVAGYGSMSAFGIRSSGELYVPRAYICVYAAKNNCGISYTASEDLVIGNINDENNDTLQIIVGNTGTNSSSTCVSSRANVTKLLSGIYYSERSMDYTIISSNLMIGNSEFDPTLESPIIYSNSPITAVNAYENEVSYYSGIVSNGIKAANVNLPAHYVIESDYDTDDKEYSYLDIEKHDLIIHANGGISTVDSIKVPYDHYIEAYLDDDSITLSREGYTFIGWTLDEAGKKDLAFVKMEESDIDIYAQWKVNAVKPDQPGASNQSGEKRDNIKENQIIQDSLNKCKVKVTSINSANRTVAYMGCISLNAEKIVIPNEIIIGGQRYKVTEIVNGAFKNNKKITNVTMGTNMEHIGTNAFQGCVKLKTAAIGNNVTTFGDKAFYKCTSLTKITIPSQVKVIGKNAFNGCTKLKRITIKTMELTEGNVGNNAFKNINKKAIVKVPAKKLSVYKRMLKKKGVTGKKQRVKK